MESVARSGLQYQHLVLFFTASAIFLLVIRLIIAAYSHLKLSTGVNGIATFGKFFYASFLKPHNGDSGTTGQQAALESFYKAQVSASLYNRLPKYS